MALIGNCDSVIRHIFNGVSADWNICGIGKTDSLICFRQRIFTGHCIAADGAVLDIISKNSVTPGGCIDGIAGYGKAPDDIISLVSLCADSASVDCLIHSF